MGILDLYSKRKRRRERQGQEDVYQYDVLPEPFRVQVIHIWADAIGGYRDTQSVFGAMGDTSSNERWDWIHAAIAREKGVFRLTDGPGDPFKQCREFLLQCGAEDALDLIELTFRFIDTVMRRVSQDKREYLGLIPPDDAVEEVNGRFREHGIGYEFVSGEIIRIDSKYLHAETVKPALSLLHGAGKQFSGPLQEFLTAHERHREGKQKEAIQEALKAFESTMKAICDARKWAYDKKKATAKDLIQVVFDNHLIPDYLQSHFTSLRAVLEAGVPTVRNKTSGHGQGATPTSVPDHVAAYALHLAASNIVLLVESHNAKK